MGIGRVDGLRDALVLAGHIERLRLAEVHRDLPVTVDGHGIGAGPGGVIIGAFPSVHDEPFSGRRHEGHYLAVAIGRSPAMMRIDVPATALAHAGLQRVLRDFFKLDLDVDRAQHGERDIRIDGRIIGGPNPAFDAIAVQDVGRQVYDLELAERAAVGIDVAAGVIRIDRQSVPVHHGDGEIEHVRRRRSIVGAQIDHAEVHLAVRARRQEPHPRGDIDIGVRVTGINARTGAQLPGGDIAQVVAAARPSGQLRVSMNHALAAVVGVLDTGVRGGTIEQIVAVAPNDTVGDRRLGPIEAPDAAVSGRVELVDHDRAIGDRRRRGIQIKLAAAERCGVVGDDTVGEGRRRQITGDGAPNIQR